MRKRAIVVVASAAILTTAGIGMAAASVPGSSGSIHGCYGNSDGRLRVIDADAGQVCNQHSETPLDWAQVGPQGPAGPQGQTGAIGPAGTNVTPSSYYVTSLSSVATIGELHSVTPVCDAGDYSTGGGFSIRARYAFVQPDPSSYRVQDSSPYASTTDGLTTATGWEVEVLNISSPVDIQFTAWADCVHSGG